MRKILILCSLMLSVHATDKMQSISFDKSLSYLLQNIQPAGTAIGVVVASPSRRDPDYFYHWVRDAALVMNTIMDLLLIEADPIKKQSYENLLKQYVIRVQLNQSVSGEKNLGEPKYHVDGKPFRGPWGRPQHDGPALRAITLIRFANYLLDEGQRNFVVSQLAPLTFNKNDSRHIIQRDIQYIEKNWNKVGFDYWEEIKGLHFATAMVQRKALVLAAQFFHRLHGSKVTQNLYRKAIYQLDELLWSFWSEEQSFIRAHLKTQSEADKSGLDVSTLLGVLLGEAGTNTLFQVNHPHVAQTVKKLEASFMSLYRINSNRNVPVIGRYPEDRYNGYHTSGEGNGWFLATFALAQYYFELAKQIQTKTYSEIDPYIFELIDKNKEDSSIVDLTLELDQKAWSYLERANEHADREGRMSEQMNRHHGYMQGAPNLTWSYSAHISALLAI